MQGKTNQSKIGPIQGVNKEIITDEMLTKNIDHADDFIQMQYFYRITSTIDSISLDPEKAPEKRSSRKRLWPRFN